MSCQSYRIWGAFSTVRNLQIFQCYTLSTCISIKLKSYFLGLTTVEPVSKLHRCLDKEWMVWQFTCDFLLFIERKSSLSCSVLNYVWMFGYVIFYFILHSLWCYPRIFLLFVYLWNSKDSENFSKYLETVKNRERERKIKKLEILMNDLGKGMTPIFYLKIEGLPASLDWKETVSIGVLTLWTSINYRTGAGYLVSIKIVGSYLNHFFR